MSPALLSSNVSGYCQEVNFFRSSLKTEMLTRLLCQVQVKSLVSHVCDEHSNICCILTLGGQRHVLLKSLI